MRLIELRPGELQEVVAANWPVLMAVGVVEYHGPHLPIGTDILLAQRLCEEVERRCRCVLAPPLPFGPTGSWAGGARDGEIDFPPDAFFAYARAALRGLLDLGFRRIYVVQHHQGAEGVQQLCLRRAAAELALEDGRASGPGWGRLPPGTGPYPAVFGRIRIGGLDAFLPAGTPPMPGGHAGQGETQLLMAAAPALVHLEDLPADRTALPRWLQDAADADPAAGRSWFERCVEAWARELGGAVASDDTPRAGISR